MAEGGGVGGVARHQHLVRVLVAAIAPAYEVVAAIGRGRQRGVVAVVVGAAAAHRAGVARVGHHHDGVRIVVEVGRERHVVAHRDGARVLCRAVVPVVEGIAGIGRSRQRHHRSFLVGAAAAHRASFHGVDVGRNSVVDCALFAEDGSVGGIARHRDLAWVVGVAVLPAGELKVAGRRGRKGRRVAVVEGAAARYRAAVGGVGVDGDDVVVLRERGCVGGVSVHRDGARVLRVAVLPLAEGVARIGGGCQGDSGAFGVGASTGHRASARGRHVGGDGVVVDGSLGEVSRVGGVFGHRETVARVSAHHRSVLLPALKLVAAGGRGCQGAGGTCVVGAAAAHGAPGVVVGVGRDGVFRNGFLNTHILDVPIVGVGATILETERDGVASVA